MKDSYLKEVLKNLELNKTAVDDTSADSADTTYSASKIEERISEIPSGGVEEAPIDTKQYGRKDAGWTEVVAGGHTQNTDTNLGTLGTKNPPVDADLVTQRDSDSSFALFTSTWTQIKAFLKTYFDGLYSLLGHTHTDLHTQNTDTGTTGNTFTVDSDSTTGKIILDVALNTGENHSLTITNLPLTEDRTITLPNESGTMTLTTHTHPYLPNGLSDYTDIGTPVSTDTFLMLTSSETTQGLTLDSLLKYLDTIYVKL